MKTTKYTFYFCLFTFAFFTSSIAQLEEKPKVDEKAEISSPNSTQAINDKIEFKNETTNPILTITDEGSNAASILIPQGPILTDPNDNDKLYNVGGTLHWNGNALGTNNSAAGWMRPITGGKIYPTDLADKVGIGTNNPKSKLSVGGIGDAIITTYSETTSGIGILGKATSGGSGIHGEANGSNGRGIIGIAEGINGIAIYGSATGTTSYGGYFLGRGYFSDNVGIGTINPLSKLSVGGNGDATITTYSETTSGIGILGKATSGGSGIYGEANGSNGRGVIGIADGINGIAIYGSAAGTTSYGGYFLGRGYFSDNVGIGTINPLSKLSVGGNGNSSAIIYGEATATNAKGIYGFTSASVGLGVYGETAGGSTSGIAVAGYANGASGKGVVGSGKAYDFDAVGAGVNYGATSSRRWKKNIVEIDNPLDKLSQIRGVYFEWDTEHGGQHDVGMIAEEVGKVLPEIVVYEENGIDADGMDYSKLTPLLVEVAKAQQKKIEELEEKLSKIESLLNGKRFTSADN